MPKKKSNRQRKPSAKARDSIPDPPPAAAAPAAAAAVAAPPVSARGKSYAMDEDMNMLKHCAAQERVPATFTAWETVASLHEADGYDRTPESLRKRFATLHRKKIKTGDPLCPKNVREAKRLFHRLKEECDFGDGQLSGSASDSSVLSAVDLVDAYDDFDFDDSDDGEDTDDDDDDDDDGDLKPAAQPTAKPATAKKAKVVKKVKKAKGPSGKPIVSKKPYRSSSLLTGNDADVEEDDLLALIKVQMMTRMNDEAERRQRYEEDRRRREEEDRRRHRETMQMLFAKPNWHNPGRQRFMGSQPGPTERNVPRINLFWQETPRRDRKRP